MNDNNKVKNISVQEVKKRLESNPDLCIIDVRELYEWQAVHIPEALHIPKDTLIDVIASHVSNMEQPIYLHCRSGMRSLYAAQCLIEMGYREVYSIDGGIVEWECCGYPVVK